MVMVVDSKDGKNGGQATLGVVAEVAVATTVVLVVMVVVCACMCACKTDINLLCVFFSIFASVFSVAGGDRSGSGGGGGGES
jgi:hypothetical protein